jgi:hypothetical protein
MKTHVQKAHQGNHYGIWIDRSRAMLCKRDKHGAITTEEIHSGVETHPRFAGEGTDKTGLFGRTIDHQGGHQGHISHDLHTFLRKVADRLLDPVHVTVIGPAGVRFELQKELERRKEFKEVPMENRAADKMTLEELIRMVEHEPAF